MVNIIVWSIPLAFVWIILANQPTLAGFVIGYIFGVAILLLIGTYRTQRNTNSINILRLPLQVVFFIFYALSLAWDIVFSGIDVARRLLTRDISTTTQPDLITIETKTDAIEGDQEWLIAALSAHAITITPGSLVVDFSDDEHHREMIVHVLDNREWTKEVLQQEQDTRVKRIKRWLGL
jgi:multisubunit Na+/H+ antiporter MnhE subunit